MSEYIEREAALAALGDCPYNWTGTDAERQAEQDWIDHQDAIRTVPAADVRPVVRGRWKEVPAQRRYGCLVRYFECSVCFAQQSYGESAFCPHCGSYMRGGEGGMTRYEIELKKDAEAMEEAMSRTANRCDIWQDRIIYQIAKAVWDILQVMLRRDDSARDA